MTETRSTCPYCGVGCGVIIASDGERITGVRGDPEHPANRGRLCSKGSTLHLTASPVVLQTQRLRQPQGRAERGAALQSLGWDEAEARVAQQLLRIRAEHGPQAIGFYLSGQLLTEDYQAFNKLARGVIGTPHIDSNSRLCMSSAVAGYKQSLGADAPPTCYEDLELADCLFIAGANPAWAHPVLFRRIEAARAARPASKLIVVDPRRSESAELADLHLAIRPGSDVALFHGLLHACIWEGWVNEGFIARHTRGFEALKALVREHTPRRAAHACGVPESQILQAAQWFARAGATLSLYCMGLNQSSQGTAKNSALINLHLATGQIGRPGAGPFSLTGQPNAMGGRETGGMATLLPGHRDPADPADREAVARLWGVPALPGPGHTAVALFEAAARGEIKALWIVCTNPAHSMPDQALVREALRRCELVVLQEAFAGTATAAFADVLLPASTWGEKEGTVTNSERRISRVRAAVAPPGEARADWRIARDIGRRLEARLRPGQASLLAWESPEALWREHREATRGRDLDITGLSYALLEQAPRQWPCPQGRGSGQARLYEDGVFATADGRARFIAVPDVAPAEALDARHPFALNSGRLRDQWHGMSRSGRVAALFGHVGAPRLGLAPQDIARRGLKAGELVRVRSRRGELVVPLEEDATLGPQQASLPMHWGSEYLSGVDARGQVLPGVNALTQPVACAQSRQPELKFAAVAVEPVALPWRVFGGAWVVAARAEALRDALRGLMAQAPYGCVLPVPAEDGALQGWQIEAAFDAPPAPEWLATLVAALGLQAVGALRYADPRRGQRRLLRLSGGEAQAWLQALLRVGERRGGRCDGDWLDALWLERAPVAPLGSRLLAPDLADAPPASPASPQVCQCFAVREDRIRACLSSHAALAPAPRLQALQRELRCGTQCGSCLPALRRLNQALDATSPP
ncbi:molybdopterin-dependent oxidoreductase [Pelomonas sp. CA6]|uniref:nitrate reductase n=1 Tax=Pelomonas sp. CA6 TaxID=2907999 RepID=UPI001F4C4B98|nr:nitrate reductase [Pelomonas sp. CA6]MCH7344693.1 molybdopterin-dependent oxidoreductase [Pelomonas sp. CA6]